ncbi:hypothetical protein HPB50_004911 [Hyalomma asiaticum]|uniref:Uncharacterized protein n=1 Tax=Hyalomma asiaticum TaxID=266040 RepID=A0ACB7RZ55_HYAAI|nr:hypothetical protein HPB50_004911 [Hyalomma asiaticum]
MLSIVDCTLFGVLVVGNFLLGMYFSLRKKSLRIESASVKLEMFLGSRALKILPLAASSAASIFSSTGLIGFTAHYYAFGWHLIWAFLGPFLCLPMATRVFIPVLYRLRITSVFEYIRLRFSAAISLTTCAIYIFLTWETPATYQRRHFRERLVIRSKSREDTLSFQAKQLSIAFRSMAVWSEAPEATVLFLNAWIHCSHGTFGCPGVDGNCGGCFRAEILIVAALVVKVILDSRSPSSQATTLSDIDLRKYVFETAVASAFLLLLVYVTPFVMTLALTVWFRGCDPTLLGEIKNVDQVSDEV